jgi:hypothetical protein
VEKIRKIELFAAAAVNVTPHKNIFRLFNPLYAADGEADLLGVGAAGEAATVVEEDAESGSGLQ